MISSQAVHEFGSFYSEEDKLFAVMRAEEDFVMKRSGKLRIWVDLYKTTISETVLTKFCESIIHMQTSILWLAIIGLSLKDQRRLLHLMKNPEFASILPIRFFSDPEDSKSWLVSERG